MPNDTIFADALRSYPRLIYDENELQRLIDKCYQFDAKSPEGIIYKTNVLPLLNGLKKFMIESDPEFQSASDSKDEYTLSSIINNIRQPLEVAMQRLRITTNPSQEEHLSKIMNDTIKYCSIHLNVRLIEAKMRHAKIAELYDSKYMVQK